jgi:hypothetical protein
MAILWRYGGKRNFLFVEAFKDSEIATSIVPVKEWKSIVEAMEIWLKQ